MEPLFKSNPSPSVQGLAALLDAGLPIAQVAAAYVAGAKTDKERISALRDLAGPQGAALILGLACVLCRARPEFSRQAVQLSLTLCILIGLTCLRDRCRSPVAILAQRSLILYQAEKGKGSVAGALDWIEEKASKGGEWISDTAQEGWEQAQEGGRWLYERGREGAEQIQRGASRVFSLSKDSVKWAMRQVFGQRIGNFLINVLEVLTGTLSQMAFGMLTATLQALADLAAGNPWGALDRILVGVNESLIMPALGSIAASVGMTLDKLQKIVRAAARKNKFMALQLVGLVLSAVSINVPNLIMSLIALLRPVMVMVLEQVGGSAGRIGAKAVDVGCTIFIMLANGVGTLTEICETVAAKIGLTSPASIQAFRDKMSMAFAALANLDLGGFGRWFVQALQTAPTLGQAQGKLGKPSVQNLLRQPVADFDRFVHDLVASPAGRQAVQLALQRSM